MSARTAFHPGSPSRRTRRGGAAHAQRRGPDPRADRLTSSLRDEQRLPPRISFEVLLAVAIVLVCMVGAMAVGAAFTLQV